MEEKIVKNGCNGKCCESFTLPFSMSEFDRMMIAVQEHNEMVRTNTDDSVYIQPPTFLKDDGTVSKCYGNSDIEQIYDMVIPLGKSLINPNQINAAHSTISERVKFALGVPEEEPLTEVDFKKFNTAWQEWSSLIDGEVYVDLYTCKNFDTEKRICKIYDTRPGMCKSFGRGCCYESCNFHDLNYPNVKQEDNIYITH